MMRPANFVVLMATCAALLYTPHSVAQVLEEVVVTAQKREQSLQDVGISVTAFTGEQMRALGVSETLDIDEQIPGLLITDFGSGATTVFTIRGSSQLDFADTQEPPVAVYTDNIYNSFLGGVGFSFFDLDRVEVLRGPQGTLFGRNATGGVVQLLSKRPTREFEGYFEATGGEYGQHRFEGALSGPLSDTASARISMAYHANSGYLDNLTLPDSHANEIGNYSGRAQLLLEPNEDFSLLLKSNWSFDDTTGQQYSTRAVAFNANGLSSPNPSLAVHQATCEALGFGPGAPAAPSADCMGTPDDGNPFTVMEDQDGQMKRDVIGFSGELVWNRDGVEITNIFNWTAIQKRYVEGAETSPLPFFDYFADLDATQISEEFRVAWETDKAQFTVGAFYLNIDSHMHTGVDPLFFGFTLDNRAELKTESWSVFGQVEWNFAPNLTAIGGFRWTEDDKDLIFLPSCRGLGIPGNDCGPIAGPTSAQSTDVDTSRSEGDFSGVIELDWTPNDDWLVYGKVSRGHKAGGYNAGPASFFDVSRIEFDRELLWSYEVGFKATLFDGSTRVNSSAYFYDYKNFQSFELIGIDLFLSNRDAENKGFELEIITNPWDGWEFLAGVGVQDGIQKDYDFNGVIRDRPLPNAPDVMINALGRYEWSALMGGTMSVQVDGNYVGNRSLNAVDHPALLDSGKGYVVVNAKLGWTSADGKWDADLWVKNLGDETYYPTSFEFTGFTGTEIRVVAPPRWVGGTVRYSFGG